jgi:hypothetical protein
MIAGATTLPTPQPATHIAASARASLTHNFNPRYQIQISLTADRLVMSHVILVDYWQGGRNMRINTKMRLAALLYLMAAYAVALPALALFTDLVINGGIIDMWQGSYSFLNLLDLRKILYLQFAGLGAILGFVYWLFFFRKYRHHDPLDKYFK